MKVTITSLVLLISRCLAHATMNPNLVSPNSYAVSQLRIPHGCGNSPTFLVSVKIPSEIQTAAKPVVVPGWNITLGYRPLPVPITLDSGEIVNKTVDSISWRVLDNSSALSTEFYQDFGISLKIPNSPEGTKLYFPTTQSCLDGNSTAWVDTAGSGAKYPSPLLWVNATSAAEKIATGTSVAKSSAIGYHGAGLVPLILMAGAVIMM